MPGRSALAVEVLPSLRPTGREVADVVAPAGPSLVRRTAGDLVAQPLHDPRTSVDAIASGGIGADATYDAGAAVSRLLR